MQIHILCRIQSNVEESFLNLQDFPKDYYQNYVGATINGRFDDFGVIRNSMHPGNFNAEFVQKLPHPGSIGVNRVADKKLVADRDDLCLHGSEILHSITQMLPFVSNWKSILEFITQEL